MVFQHNWLIANSFTLIFISLWLANTDIQIIIYMQWNSLQNTAVNEHLTHQYGIRSNFFLTKLPTRSSLHTLTQSTIAFKYAVVFTEKQNTVYFKSSNSKITTLPKRKTTCTAWTSTMIEICMKITLVASSRQSPPSPIDSPQSTPTLITCKKERKKERKSPSQCHSKE